jgi:hypothetical protein
MEKAKAGYFCILFLISGITYSTLINYLYI